MMRILLILSLLIVAKTVMAAPLSGETSLFNVCAVSSPLCQSNSSSKLSKRSFVSEDFDLREGEEPNYEGLSGKRQFSSKAERTIGLALSLMQQNNPEDKKGTLYLAKLMSHFWPGTSTYEALNEDYKGGDDLLFSIASKGTFTDEGKIVPHCVLPQAKCMAEILKN